MFLKYMWTAGKKKGNFKKSVFDFYETLTEKYL